MSQRRQPRKKPAAAPKKPPRKTPSAKPAKATRTVRLLKVLVQAVVVVDDGSNLEEMTMQPITVPAAAWAAFPEQFAKDFAELKERVEGGESEPIPE